MSLTVTHSKYTARIIPEKVFTLKEIYDNLPYSYAETKSYVNTLCKNGLMVKVGKDKYRLITEPSMLEGFVIGMN